MHDVPVPQGLAERLLTRLAPTAAAGPPALSSPADLATTPDQAGPAEPPGALPHPAVAPPGSADLARPASRSPRLRVTRRWWLCGAAATAAAAVWIVVTLWPDAPAPLTRDALLAAAVEQFLSETLEASSPAATHPLQSAPAALPVSEDVVIPDQTRWRELADGLAGRHAVAYDLAPLPGDQRATLYVFRSQVHSQVRGLPDVPPRVPALATQGLCLSAWQTGDMVYVLVVQGRPDAWRRLVKAPYGTLT
jgi:hypothetical protein